jgi:cell division protein FtsB
MKTENKWSYLWNWIKIAFISIVFFALMLLQVFQADKIQDIREDINQTKKDLVKITLKLSEVDLQIENIKNGVIIDEIATESFGMIKANKNNYYIIENNYENNDS